MAPRVMADRQSGTDDFSWPINWAVDVVDFLIGVHEQDRAEIRWHTHLAATRRISPTWSACRRSRLPKRRRLPSAAFPNGVLEVAHA